jgi:hypothetical protein
VKCSQLAYETGDLVYLDQGGFAWPISEDWQYSKSLVPGRLPRYTQFFFSISQIMFKEIGYMIREPLLGTCPECGKIGIAALISLGLFRNDIFSCECYTRHHWLDSYSEILMEAYDKALRYWS